MMKPLDALSVSSKDLLWMRCSSWRSSGVVGLRLRRRKRFITSPRRRRALTKHDAFLTDSGVISEFAGINRE